jgi:hypothetical protein
MAHPFQPSAEGPTRIMTAGASADPMEGIPRGLESFPDKSIWFNNLHGR